MGFIREIDRWVSSALGITPVHKILFLFAIAMGILIYVAFQVSNEPQQTPCSIGGTPLRCYHITPKMCEVTWARSEEACKDFVHKMGLPPGRPIGATLFKCQFADLDGAFVYSRRSTPECNDLFRDLDDWKRANGIH